MLDANLKGPFLCMRAVVPHMIGAGGGSIVALGSTLGQIVAPGYPAYCASKCALTNLCKQAAIEHAADGIRVNVVAPSACDTGLFMRMAESTGDPRGHRAHGRRPTADGPARRGARGVRRGRVLRVATRRRTRAARCFPSTAASPPGGCDAWATARRVLDADAHVIEPADLFAPWTGERMPMDLPPTTPMVPCGDLELLADQFEHGFDAAVVPAGHGRAGHRRRRRSTRRSGCSCRSCPSSRRPSRPTRAARTTSGSPSYCASSGRTPLRRGHPPARRRRRAPSRRSRWCADAGLVAMMARPNHLYGRNLGDPAYDPLYDALAEHGLVLAVHEGLGLRGTRRSARTASRASRRATP